MLITLPQEFKKRNSSKRISFGAKNLLIDNFGVSGKFFSKSILSLNDGDAGKWQFSVDSLGLDIQANNFAGAGFHGKIVLPVSNEGNQGALAYKAIIGTNQNYTMNVLVEEDVDFNIFRSKAKLFKDSYVELNVIDGKFEPKANLTGLMSFSKDQKDQLNTTNSSNTSNFEEIEFKGLSFQNFEIQTARAPYINVGYAGYKDNVELPKIAGFQMGFYDIEIKSKGTKEAEIGFNGFINLDESGIKGDTRLRVIGELVDGDYMKWRYKTTEVDEITVDVKRKSFEFHGKLNFFRDNPKYGKGLTGKLNLYSESLGIELKSKGIFGNVDGYRYWFVDAYGRPTKNDNKNFTIYDIGGGVYHHMRKAGHDEKAESLSGIHYTPHAGTALGFKALAAFEVKKGATFTGLVGIEMSFNTQQNGGGVSRVGFYGAAALIKGKSNKARDPFGSVGDMQKTVSAKEQALSNFHELSLDKEGIKYFATEVFPDILTGEELFAAQVGLDLDFENKTYWGMFDVFLNAGPIKGEGEKNRLGYLEFYNSPTDWYIYVGTPDKRFGIKGIPIGPLKAKINLYFMTGTILPPLAPVDPIVVDILNLNTSEQNFGSNISSKLSQGTGYAFGAKFELYKSFDWGIVYASARAGVGFDFLIRDYGDASCKGRSGTIGMDGWYAMGQLYLYLQGEIGAQVKLFGKKKRVRILEAGLALLAQGQLPNPWYVKGYAGVSVKVLGLIKINARLKVTIGNECEIIGKTALDEIEIIADIIPADKDTDVDVFDAVQVAFNVPVEKEVYIREAGGGVSYRIHIDKMEVKNENKVIVGKTHFNENNDVIFFESTDILPPETKLTVTIRLTFEQKPIKGGNWLPVMANNTPYVEEKSIIFTTGKAPTYIPLKNIVHMYPIKEQRYFLPKEQTKGTIQLQKGQDYLFGMSGFKDELAFVDETGRQLASNFTYDKARNILQFDIPNLDNEKLYAYKLITKKNVSTATNSINTVVENAIDNTTSITSNTLTGSQSTDAALVRLEYNFSTSKYNTLQQKINKLKVDQYFNLVDKTASVAMLGISIKDYEGFDMHEVVGSAYTRNQPLLHAKGMLTDEYYKDQIYPLLYKEYPLNGTIELERELETLGFPPVKKIELTERYRVYSQHNPNHSDLKHYFPFRWRLARAFYLDFIELQTKILAKCTANQMFDKELFERYKYIATGRFPYIEKDDYQVELEYIPSGMSSGKKSTINYKNTF